MLRKVRVLSRLPPQLGRGERCTTVRSFSDVIMGINDVRIPFQNRSDVVLSASKYAAFADGCCVGHVGDTSVMVTVVGRTKPSNTNFMPLTVDYRQKAAAAGRIPMNHHRRDLAPTPHEILTSRLIDRSIRPLFPTNYFNETQLICNLLAVDGVHDPEVLCINAASAALALSDIPWKGPVGAVRVGRVGEELIVNPTRRELADSSLNMVVTACSQNLVVMLEAAADNIFQQDLLKAIKTGVKECQRIVQGINNLKKTLGKPKRTVEDPPSYPELENAVRTLCEMRMTEVFRNFTHDKLSRDDAIKEIIADVLEKLKHEKSNDFDLDQASYLCYVNCKRIFRNLILESDIRCDGRTLRQLRNISSDVDMYKPLHGSAFFQRGQTQVLCTVSLDSINSVLQSDPITMLTTGLKEKNFFLHYEFPPYATKDIGRVGTVARREIGHGALAEKGIRPVIPNNFPFTIRLTSEVLQSNGSSSMASVCGGSLALLDAGVPISAPVAGVAIGLVTAYDEEDTKHIRDYKILTDILGIEDYMGDMDFKLAGTKKGITALQADIKIPGLPLKIVMEAVAAGSDAKSQIIDIMNSTISKPRLDKKSSWPVVETMDIPINKRGRFIGPGGINLKRLLVNNGVQVMLQEDSGSFNIFAPNQVAMEEAKEQIAKLLTSDNEPTLEFGAIYTAKIVEIKEQGVMVSLYSSMRPALLHNSQLDTRKVNDARVLGFEVGQEIQVKYFGLDPVSGHMRLSRKVLLSTPSNVVQNFHEKP